MNSISDLKKNLIGGQFNQDTTEVDPENGESNDDTTEKCKCFDKCLDEYCYNFCFVLEVIFLISLLILILYPYHPHLHVHIFDVSSGSDSWSESGSWNGEN